MPSSITDTNQLHYRYSDRSGSSSSAASMSRAQLSPADSLLRPGIADGYYPERSVDTPSWLERTLHTLNGFTTSTTTSTHNLKQVTSCVDKYGQPLKNISDARLAETTKHLRVKLHQEGLKDDLIHQAFALIRESAARTIGMRHFDCQLMGGWVMVHGQLAEMETGGSPTRKVRKSMKWQPSPIIRPPPCCGSCNQWLSGRIPALMR